MSLSVMSSPHQGVPCPPAGGPRLEALLVRIRSLHRGERWGDGHTTTPSPVPIVSSMSPLPLFHPRDVRVSDTPSQPVRSWRGRRRRRKDRARGCDGTWNNVSRPREGTEALGGGDGDGTQMSGDTYRSVRALIPLPAVEERQAALEGLWQQKQGEAAVTPTSQHALGLDAWVSFFGGGRGGGEDPPLDVWVPSPGRGAAGGTVAQGGGGGRRSKVSRRRPGSPSDTLPLIDPIRAHGPPTPPAGDL